MSEQRKPIELSHDPATDVVTIDGYKFSGDLLRQMTASPLGVRFRIIERKDGCITVGTERDPVEATASDMLEALELLQGFDFRLDDSDHSKEIRRRAVTSIARAKGRP